MSHHLVDLPSKVALNGYVPSSQTTTAPLSLPLNGSISLHSEIAPSTAEFIMIVGDQVQRLQSTDRNKVGDECLGSRAVLSGAKGDFQMLGDQAMRIVLLSVVEILDGVDCNLDGIPDLLLIFLTAAAATILNDSVSQSKFMVGYGAVIPMPGAGLSKVQAASL